MCLITYLFVRVFQWYSTDDAYFFKETQEISCSSEKIVENNWIRVNG